MDENKNQSSSGSYESPHKDEYDKMVDRIKAQRKAMSTSIWTDEPLLKPYKSVWIDDNEDTQPKESKSTAKAESTPEPVQKKSSAPAYYDNPVIKDGRNEKMAFGQTPENYDNVIMPFINDYSVERKLPDQRRHISRKPKANAAVELDAQRRRQPGPAAAQRYAQAAQPAQPQVHKLRNERFFDDEGEPIHRHVPEKSERARPTMVPLSKREQRSTSARPAAQRRKRRPEGAQTARPESRSINRPAAAAIIKDNSAKTEEKQTPLSREMVQTEKNLQFFNALICVGAIFLIAIILLVMTMMGKREKESPSENRKLAEFPKFSLSSLFSGEFTNGITTYFTDTIPGREKFKGFSAGFTECFGFSIGDVKVNGSLKKVEQEKYEEPAVTTKVSINTAPVTTTSADSKAPDSSKSDSSSSDSSKSNTKKDEVVKIPENTNEGKLLGSVVVYGSGKETRGLVLSYVDFNLGKKFAEAINKWKEDLGESVNVYAMPAPLSSAFYMPSNMKDMGTDQNENIKNIVGNLKGVVGINCVNELAKHMDEDIYARTDHHWLPLGAYYGTKVFAEAAQVDYPSLDQYDKITKEGFLGTLYTYSNYDQGIQNNPDTFVYYKPKNIKEVTCQYYDTSFANPFKPYGTDESGLFYDSMEGSNCYLSFLGSDSQIVEIKTPCKNNRVLVVYKNSYGNAMIPFLTNSFSKIYVCDYRYFNINGVDFCKKVGCTDLLFTGAISLICSDVGINSINNIRVQ